MRNGLIVLSFITGLSVISACAAPTATPTPVVVKETVVVPGPPVEKIVERVVTVTPAPTAKPKRANSVRVNLGAGDVQTLDPSYAAETTAGMMVEENFVGLVRLNEETSVVEPAMATQWDVSPDSRAYTFTLRSDIPWVRYDGNKNQVVPVQTCKDKDGKTKDRWVTAKDFEYGILRSIDPKALSPYAYGLTFALEGAPGYATGIITDTTQVGVKALDDTKLLVRFGEDNAYNLGTLGLWTAVAQPRWLIEGDECTDRRGDKWTESGSLQSYGPFALREWTHDSALTLVKNPFWATDLPAVPQPKIDQVRFAMLDDAAAAKEFEAGNLDSIQLTTEVERFKNDANLAKLIKTVPTLATYYYGFNTKAKFVDDARVRRALSLSIDRAGLVKAVLKSAQEPALWFCRPGLLACPTPKEYPNSGIKFDVTKAQAELAAYLKDKNLTADKIDLTFAYSASTTNQKIAEFVQQSWKDNLGVTVKLSSVERKAYLNLVKSKDTPAIWSLTWLADYFDANNFTREVFAVGGWSNPADRGVPYGGVNWKNDKFEQWVRQAALEKDVKKRADLYAQAEQLLVNDDAVIAPIYWYTRALATQPWIARTFASGGNERFEKWQVAQE